MPAWFQPYITLGTIVEIGALLFALWRMTMAFQNRLTKLETKLDVLWGVIVNGKRPGGSHGD